MRSPCFQIEVEHLSLAAEMTGKEFSLSGVRIGSVSVSDDCHANDLSKLLFHSCALYPRHECRGFTARGIRKKADEPCQTHPLLKVPKLDAGDKHRGRTGPFFGSADGHCRPLGRLSTASFRVENNIGHEEAPRNARERNFRLI